MKKLPLFLLTVSLILFALGQFGRVSFLGGLVNGYLYEFFLLLYLAVMVYRYKLAPFKYALRSIPFGFVFVSALLLTFFISHSKFTAQENVVGFLYTARFIFYFIFLIYVSFFFKKNKESKRFPAVFIYFMGSIIVLSGLQFLFYSDLRNLFYLGWDEHVARVFGLFLEPYVAASVFGICMLFLLLNDDFLRRKKLVLFFLIPLLLLAFLTYSRGFYVSFFITLAFLFVKTRQKKFLLLIAALAVFLATAFFSPRGEGTTITRTASVSSRLTSYREGIRMWRSNPIFGVGYNRVRTLKEKNLRMPSASIPDHAASSFHSSFLIVLAATGVVGFIAYIGFLMNLFNLTQNSRYYLMFLMIFSLFDNVLLHPFILFLFALTIAFPTPSRT